jgi:hypothetical protein
MVLKIPKNPNDITKQWLLEVIKLSEKTENVEVIEISQLKEKTGFLSGAVKAKVNINGDEKNLFIKTIIGENDPFRIFYDTSNLDELEIRFYKEYLPALIDFTKETSEKKIVLNCLENMVVKFYCGDYSLDKEERGFYLILDDLSSQYKVKTGSEGLNFGQIKDILVKMAKFHAMAYAFNAKNPAKVKDWNLRSWCEKASKHTGFIALMESCFDKLIKNYESEKKPGLVKSVDNLQSHWISLYSEKVDRKFVTHGDLWINNIMVKNNSDEAIILDWQTLCPDHPVFDVAFLICTSLTPENLEKWTEDLIKYYVESFQEACVDFQMELPFDLEKFKEMLFDQSILLFMGWKSMGDENTRRKNITECISKYFDLIQSPSKVKLSKLLKLYSSGMLKI